MELVSKVVLFGIIESIVAAPVEISSASLNRSPLRLVLTSNLVPDRIILWNTTTSLYLSSGSDIAQKLVGIR